MSLNTQFTQYLEDTIVGIIEGIPILKREYPKFKNEWQYENEFDFLYGCVVGQILGTGLTAFKMIYERDASPEEILQIGELVESYFPFIREKIKEKDAISQ